MPLRLSIVSYLNSVPFLNGLRRIFSEEELTISLDIPSECAEKLKRGEVEIGLIPVAALPSIPGAVVFSDYCIACDGEVGSVLLFSDKPVQEIRTVLLDYQSRTSVRLVKLLLEHHWKKAVEYLPSSPGYEEQIKGDVAGVVIGD
ncbi:MAG: menaquinone biosynthetic enzyme MqnA/MqnD family protein, partial [Flavobacteriales bacterium]